MSDGLQNIKAIYEKINALTINEWEGLSTDMEKSNPLLLEIYLGFNGSTNFTPTQLEVTKKILATIWLYNGGDEANVLTAEKLIENYNKNAQFVTYLGGENKEDLGNTALDYILNNSDCVAFAFSLNVLQESPEFKNFGLIEIGDILMELKSVNDCLVKTSL